MRKMSKILSCIFCSLGVALLTVGFASEAQAAGWTCWSSCSCDVEIYQGGHSERCACPGLFCLGCNRDECPSRPDQGNGCVSCD